MAHKGLSTQATTAPLCPRARALAQPASQPGIPTSPPTLAITVCEPNGATGRASLASGGAELPAKPATLPGGGERSTEWLLAGQAKPCLQRAVLEPSFLKTMTLVLGYTWVL